MEEQKDKYLAELEERIEVLKSQIDYKPNIASNIITYSSFALSVCFIFFGREVLEWLGFVNSVMYENAPLIAIAFTFYLGFLIAILSARESQNRQRKKEEIISLEAQRRTITEFFKVVVRFSRFMLLPELARFPAQDSDLLAL
jgi:hypothetical protein